MRKGFTLVELLAVIVLLATISAITFFAIGSVIKKSKNELSDVQIDNIVQAAKTYYLKEGMADEKETLLGTESCVNVKYLINGGYIDNQEVIDLTSDEKLKASVKITYNNNKYKYEYQDKECPIPTCKVVSGDGTKIGDEIECAGEYFYVINNNKDKISMLAKYNLNLTSYKQSITPGISTFSSTNYWYQSGTYNGYTKSSNGYYNVYGSNSNLYQYIYNYEKYLTDMGVKSAKATLIKYEELTRLGCATNCNNSPYSWVYSTSYWTGTTASNNAYYLWGVNSNGSLSSLYYTSYSGIRPVINISISEF